MATTFKPFDERDIVVGKPKTTTFPAWADIPSDVDTTAQSVISTFYTNSLYTGKTTVESNYFWNIYNEDTATNANAEPQFSIALATTSSLYITSSRAYLANDADVYTYPSYAIYRQLVNTVTNGGSYVNWSYVNEVGTTITPAHVYVISIARSRIKDYIEPANTQGSSSWQINFSGSTALITLTCAPASSSNQTAFNIIFNSGSLYTGQSGNGGHNTVFGRFYSDKGLFVLDADRLWVSGALASAPTQSMLESSGYYTPSSSLYNIYASLVKGGYFKARSVEKVQSTNYFARAKNFEFNFSNNPTWTSGSDNEVLTEFYEEQKTYITAVGLYDGDPSVEGSGQLVAIAKLSKPILKTADSEALIKIRLDF